MKDLAELVGGNPHSIHEVARAECTFHFVCQSAITMAVLVYWLLGLHYTTTLAKTKTV